ncbi:hypothetical protein QTP88_001442 [Uroleucon formosanum]
MVSGSGVYTGRHVAGSQGSSSGNHEGTEVASQASVTLPTTSAESVMSQEGTQHFNIGDHGSPLSLAMRALKEQLVGQQSALNLMLDKAIVLQIIRSKSKSPQVQAAISDVLNAVEVITNAHDKVVRSFKSTMRTAQDHVYNCPKPGGEKPHSSKSTSTQTQIEVTATKAATTNADTVLNNANVSNCLDKQEEKLEKIMAYLTVMKDEKVAVQVAQSRPTYAQKTKTNVPTADQHKANTGKSEWTVVPRPRKKKRGPDQQPVPKNKRRLNLTLADAIAIKPANYESPTDVLKRIKQGEDIKSIGAQVSSIIESRNGELIIRLHPKDSKRSELEDALKNQLGASVAVRVLIKYEEVEVLDLDCATTEAELEICIRKALGSAENDQCIQVKSIRQSFRGVHRVTVKLRNASDTDTLDMSAKDPIDLKHVCYVQGWDTRH